jgi:hypothetical protein
MSSLFFSWRGLCRYFTFVYTQRKLYLRSPTCTNSEHTLASFPSGFRQLIHTQGYILIFVGTLAFAFLSISRNGGEYSLESRAGIFKQSMGATNRVSIGLSYRPARLHRLAEFIPWNRFLWWYAQSC